MRLDSSCMMLRPDFVFPELRPEAEGGVKSLQDKKDFAICLSGGGFRATTLALGWVRALHNAGLLQQARYLSSNSGSSWYVHILVPRVLAHPPTYA